MQKSSFLCLRYISRAIRAGKCRERRYADHIFIQIYFRMHHFVVKFSSPQAARGHWPQKSCGRSCDHDPSYVCHNAIPLSTRNRTTQTRCIHSLNVRKGGKIVENFVVDPLSRFGPRFIEEFCKIPHFEKSLCPKGRLKVTVIFTFPHKLLLQKL